MGIILLVLLGGLVAFICWRALKAKAPELHSEYKDSLASIDVNQVAEKLSQAIQKVTISYPDTSKVDWTAYVGFIDFIEKTYPLAHQNLEQVKINTHGLVYHLKGQDAGKKPVLLIAHYDVVPVEKSTLDHWEHPPFSGAIADDYVWGRGSMDMKLHLLSILEAVEMHLSKGFKPQRGLYLAFGQDEETKGTLGATAIADYFEKKGLEFDFVLDEGGCVTEEAVARVKKPLALIGIAEKGFASVRITVDSCGGHSSMPPSQTAVGALGRIISDLEDRQFKLRLCIPVRKQFEKIGTEFPFALRLLTANLWLFGRMFMKMMARTNLGNAMMRTTTATTMFEGSMAHNVLAPKASAIVNFRLLPGESIDDVVKHIKKIAGKQTVELELMMSDDPSLISPTNNEGYERIEKVIHQTFPGVLTTPFLVLGGTDSRRYEKVCSNIYRFSPMQVQKNDLDRIHNVNERISFRNIERSVQFFHKLISEI